MQLQIEAAKQASDDYIYFGQRETAMSENHVSMEERKRLGPKQP